MTIDDYYATAKPPIVNLDAMRPTDLVQWAVSCLGWSRTQTRERGVWLPYRDNGITSICGDQPETGDAGPVATDAGSNADWIALMSPAVGVALEALLLERAHELRDYATWAETGDPYQPVRTLSTLLVVRHHKNFASLCTASEEET